MEPQPGEWWIVVVDLGDRQGMEVACWNGDGWQLVAMDGEAPEGCCEAVTRLDLAALATANGAGT
jgi:hypothetical protein